MAKKIKQLRGLEKDLPVLEEGQIGFTTDTKKVFIGSKNGNIEIPNKSQIDNIMQELDNLAQNQEVEGLEDIATIVKTTDSSANIANKLTSAKTSVKFPTGEYVLNGANIPSKKITITKPIKISGDNAVVYLEGGVQIELKSPDIEISGIDFRVRNHGTLVGQEAILLVRRNNIKLDRCKFSGTQYYYGVLIGDNELKNCDDVSITNCKFNNLGYGVLKQYGEGCSCHRLLIDNCVITNILRGDAVEINVGIDIGMVISNNYIDGVSGGNIVNAGIGIGIAGGVYGQNPLTHSREGYVTNNVIKNTERCAIHLEACNKFDISSNRLMNNNSGVGIEIYGSTEITTDSNYIDKFYKGINDDIGALNNAYIISTDKNYITRNTITDCNRAIEMGAVGEAKTQYCTGNFIRGCTTGIYVYGKAVFDISDNILEDCKIPINFNYEPSTKASLFSHRHRNIVIANNTTKFKGLPSDNMKNIFNLTNYDKMTFEGNNFILGDFARQPRTFVNEEPLYFVKGDLLITTDGNTETRKMVTANGFKPKVATTYYFACVAGSDYIHVTSPADAKQKFVIGQAIVLNGAGENGGNLITTIKEMYIANNEYRIGVTDTIGTTINTNTVINLFAVAQFKDEASAEGLTTQLNQLTARIDNLPVNLPIETVIEVGIGKAFETVTSAINSITDNSPTKRYKIKVSAGTYTERINLKAYVGIEGINRDSVIFELHRPITTPNADVTSHSMVELHTDGSYIRNITVKGSNFRYMIHAEFSNNDNRSIEVDNCYVEHFGNDTSYSWQLPHAVGAGTGRSNTVMTYKHSTFIGASNGRGVLIHDNANPTSSSTVYIEGCTIATKGGNVYEGLNLDNYASYSGATPWYIYLNNNVIQTGVSVTGTIARQRIFGGGNSMSRYYTGSDWVDSHAGIYARNTTGATIPRGTALRFSVDERSFEVFNGTSASDYSRFAGFTLRDIPNGEFGWAVNKGVVPVLFGGSVNYTDQVMINGSGTVVKYEVASVNDQRLPIGQLLQPSANTGEVRRVALVDSVKNAVIPTKVLLQGGNVVFYAWGGTPLNPPTFVGQFAIDTVSSGVYMAKGTTISDWMKLTNQ